MTVTGHLPPVSEILYLFSPAGPASDRYLPFLVASESPPGIAAHGKDRSAEDIPDVLRKVLEAATSDIPTTLNNPAQSCNNSKANMFTNAGQSCATPEKEWQQPQHNNPHHSPASYTSVLPLPSTSVRFSKAVRAPVQPRARVVRSQPLSTPPHSSPLRLPATGSPGDRAFPIIEGVRE